jgi:hypothetical protein
MQASWVDLWLLLASMGRKLWHGGANGKEGYTLVWLTESSGKAYALTILANK